jgi:hypothetical protein
MSQPFDVFISFKHLDETGKPTPDAALARTLFDFLTARNMSAFLSTVTLERHGISSYKKAIDQALDAAHVLIAVATSRAHLDSEWVRYEWDSFFSDVLSGVKPHGRLFVYVDGIVSRDLPRSLRQTQVLVHGPGSLDALYNFIANALGQQETQAPGPARLKQGRERSEARQDWEAAARGLLRRGRKIEAIKLVREATGRGLKEAKDLVESWAVGARG